MGVKIPYDTGLKIKILGIGSEKVLFSIFSTKNYLLYFYVKNIYI
jgi:hypothetical protein